MTDRPDIYYAVTPAGIFLHTIGGLIVRIGGPRDWHLIPRGAVIY